MSGIKYWLQELAAAAKREKDWRKDGAEIFAIYGADKGKKVPFNILYSNTETLLPSLYSAIPRPVVDRRFKDDDPMGKAAAEAGRRGLEFQLDTNIEGYETYDEAMRSATMDAILPGRGVTSVKYDAEIVGEEKEPAAENTKKDAAEDAAEGSPDEPAPYKAGELVCTESRKWDHFRMGYATKWSKVPWIAFAEDIDKKEAARLFGKAKATALQYSSEDDDANDNEGSKRGKDEDDTRGPRETTRIWVIWSKTERKVIFVSEQFKDGILKTTDDPLGLTGFFPIPKPMQMVQKSSDLSVTSLYSLYKEQAEELNDITRRIKRIVRAIKAKAIYDAELGTDIKNLCEGDDNDLVPSDKTSSLASDKGLQNAIWFWPVDKLITVLRELMAAREATKAVIWEIMGIADIMRGQSQASETLGAQKIKQSWGSLRLKLMQKEVMRYSRDLLRIMLEVMATKFSEETWAKMTGLPYLTEAQFAQAQQQLEAAGMAMQQAQMQPPPMPPQGQPGQPPQPPQPSPAMQQAQQAMQAAQAEMQKPKWADVIAILKDDLQRAYRIDIETNSTLEPEAAEDQKNIAELMNAIAQFLNGIQPMIESGTMPFEAAQAMLLTIVKRFRFGADVEDQIKAMQQPKPKDDGKAAAEQAKAQREQQAHDAEMRLKQFEAQAKERDDGLKAQRDQAQHAADMQRIQMEQEYAAKDHAAKMAEIEAKNRAIILKARMDEMIAESKIKVAQATAAAKEASANRPEVQQ